jgi:hypothetical protein
VNESRTNLVDAAPLAPYASAPYAISGKRQPEAFEGGTMAETDPGRAPAFVSRIEMMCDFIEGDAVRRAVAESVPVTMPRHPGSLGFDIPLWVGLGTVGLWATLDAFAERKRLPDPKCPICGGRCIPERFAGSTPAGDAQSLKELEDLRHLYAHNFAGEADDRYFSRPRHVFQQGVSAQLTCGARFKGSLVALDLPHLRYYAAMTKRVLEAVPP